MARREKSGASNDDCDLEKWNPMAHDYENRDFNRYSQGVGRDLTGSAKGKGVRLYADGIPMDLGQEGFSNLFAEYGNVLDSKLLPGRETPTSGFGFVTLETTVEAEAAIRALHKKTLGPHVLKVRPAYTDEERERQKRMRQAEAEFMSSVNRQRQQGNFPQGLMNPAARRGPLIPGYQQRFLMPGGGGLMGNAPPIPGPGVLGPRPMRGQGFLGPRPGVFHSSFNLGSRPFGPPEMGMGRGQGILPAPKSGHVEAKKTCLNCRKDGSSFRCEACKSFYCSVECQKNHWIQHKPACLEIRKFIEENNPLKYIQAAKKDEAHTDCNTEKNTSSRMSKLTDNKENRDSDGAKKDDGYETDRRKNTRNTNVTKGKPIEKPRKTLKNDNVKDPPLSSSANTKDPSKSIEKETMSKKPFGDSSSQDVPVTNVGQNNLNTDEGPVGESSPSGAGDASTNLIELSVPNGSSGKCLLTYYESPSKFWVSLEDNLAEDFEFANILHETVEMETKPLEKVKTGDIVSAKYGEMWCRARVLAVKGNNVTIFFVDVGKQESVQLQDLRLVFADFNTCPTQVLCCCLSQLKPMGSGSWSEAANSFVKEWLGEPETKIIDFTMVNRKGSKFALDVKIQNESLREALISRSLAQETEGEPSLPSGAALRQTVNKDSESSQRTMVKDMPTKAQDCEVGLELSCIPQTLDSPHKFYVMPFTETVVATVTQVEQHLLETPKKEEPYKPIVGELVMAKYSEDGLWYRAEVVAESAGKYELVFIDYGNKENTTADNIRQITDTFLIECPVQTLVCALHGITVPPELDSAVVQEELGLKMVEFLDTNGTVKMVVKKKNQHNLSVDFVRDQNNQCLCQAFQNKINSLSKSANPDPVKAALSPTGNKSPSETRQAANPDPVKAALSPKENKSPAETRQAGPTGLTNQPKVSSFSNAQNKSETTGNGTQTIKTVQIPAKGSGKIKAVVTFFKNCQEFYLRLCSGEREYFFLMQKLNSSVTSKPAVKKPEVGMIVAALFLIDQTWYRAKIVSIEGDNVTVLFLDFGNQETVQCCHLRSLPPSMISLPAQAVICSFQEVPDCPQVILQGFKQFFEELQVLVERVAGDGDQVPKVNVFKLDGTDILQLLASEAEKAVQRECKRKGESVKVQIKQTTPKLQMEKNTPIPSNVVYIMSPLELYVQPISYTEAALLLTVRITERISSEPCPVTSVAVGDLVAGRFSQDTDDTVWYRCKVLSVQDNSCLVHFIDYGNREDKEVKDLMQLVAADYEEPEYTLKCSLKGCTEENTITDEGELETIAQTEKIIVREQTDDICIVDVLDSEGITITDRCFKKSSAKSPASKLAALVLSPKKPSEEVSSQPELPFETLSENDEGHLVMVSTVKSCSEIYVIKQDGCSSSLPALMLELRRVGDSLPGLTKPSVGSLCVAKFSDDQDWYRAVIVEMCNTERCLVKFVDYGNSEETSVSELKQLTDDLKTLPALAIRCCFEGHNCDNPLDIELTHTLTSEILKIHVVENRDRVSVIVPFIAESENDDPLNITCCALQQSQVSPAPSPVPTVSDLVHWDPSPTFDAAFTDYKTIADFCCIPNAYYKKVIDLSTELEKACSQKSESVTPIVDGVYACKFADTWYRCRVCEVEGNTVLLNYVDFGNSEERNSEDLAMLLPEHLELPVYLVRCRIYGVKPVDGLTWTSSEFAEINELVQQLDNVQVTICGEDSDRKLISLLSEGVDIASILVDTGFAQSVQIQPQLDNGTIMMQPPRDGMPLRQEVAPPLPEQVDDAEDEAALLERQIAELQAKHQQLLQNKRGKKN